MVGLIGARGRLHNESEVLSDLVRDRPHEGPYAVDTIPANTTTTEVIAVPGTRTSAIDTVGDFDFFRMTLQAGFTYTFAMNGGGSGGMTDPSLALYDANGVFITLDDDSGPGFNALITFTAPTTGTYYLGANGIPTSTGNYTLVTAIVGGVDEISNNTSTTAELTIGGPSAASSIDSPGDQDWFRITLTAGQSYAFTLNGGTLADPFLALYNSAGVLVSIDDDGGDGLNAMMQFTATQSGTYYLSAEAAGSGLGDYTISAAVGPPQDPLDTLDLGFTFHTSNIAVYFATTGQHLGPTGTAARSWTSAEQAAMMSALQTLADVTNLTFTIAATADAADFVFVLSQLDPGVLGQTYPDPSIAYLEFDPDAPGWTTTGLQPGGLGYSVLIHEVGHALGLDHPHYDGLDNQIMQGVIDIFDSYGTFGLNQQVFTIMSYNDGWPGGQFGGPQTTDFGYAQTPMALDIAYLQMLYGADASRNSGDTTYVLPASNSAHPGYVAIWDTGGIDTIVAGGTGPVRIDLNSATLQSEPGGGGYVSYPVAVLGGFTIAAGVVIENATGGLGDDTLTGNAVNNVLTGGFGADTLLGNAGDDRLEGGASSDILNGGAGADRMIGGSSDDSYFVDNVGDIVTELAGEGTQDQVTASIDYTLPDNVEWLTLAGAALIGTGNALDNLLRGDELGNTLNGGVGADRLFGFNGDDTLNGDDGDDIIFAQRLTTAGAESNAYAGGAGYDTIDYTNANGGVTINLATGTATGVVGGADTLSGFEAIIGSLYNDTIVGDDGDNYIQINGGSDNIDGGAGVDTVRFINRGAINLEAGTGSTVFDVYTLANIENVIGGGEIIGNGGDNRIDARLSGSDSLSGGGGDDVILPGSGTNSLDGGSGYDILVFEVSSANVTFERDASGMLSFFGPDLHGRENVINFELIDFTDRDIVPEQAERSFSGDGTSDILFRRDDGIMASWNVNGVTINAAHFLPAAGAEWTPLGTGDFNSDANADVVWRRDDGLVYSWHMDDGVVVTANALAGIGSEWHFLAVGDFNGDFRDDLAWQRDDGLVYTWTMNGAAITAANAIAGLGAEWVVQGVGDFNRDGRDDFLWRNDAGQMVIWHMNGPAIRSSGFTSVTAGADWSVAGIGDVNGDGFDDIVLRRDGDGMVQIWSMNGTTVTSSTDIAAVDPAHWAIQNIGDYNGDGRADILWRDDTGVVYAWLLDGANIIGAGGLSGVGAEWQIIGGG
ncbi:FG-GAP-like repeat-containing protein [Terricaulis sp.]|uniref:FG-GAP-like repeat-containing protein n=1 Tax=Terricaulis sp. TaxID=2768686 RepID=UPI0037849E53